MNNLACTDHLLQPSNMPLRHRLRITIFEINPITIHGRFTLREHIHCKEKSQDFLSRVELSVEKHNCRNPSHGRPFAYSPIEFTSLDSYHHLLVQHCKSFCGMVKLYTQETFVHRCCVSVIVLIFERRACLISFQQPQQGGRETICSLEGGFRLEILCLQAILFASNWL
jgi:hypothetical protein